MITCSCVFVACSAATGQAAHPVSSNLSLCVSDVENRCIMLARTRLLRYLTPVGVYRGPSFSQNPEVPGHDHIWLPIGFFLRHSLGLGHVLSHARCILSTCYHVHPARPVPQQVEAPALSHFLQGQPLKALGKKSATISEAPPK